MNLHDLYARVCAVRPELAVDATTVVGTSLFWLGEVDEDGTTRHPKDVGWFVSDDGFEAMLCGGPNAPIAAALILARWVEALPDTHALSCWYAGENQTDWSVRSFGKDGFCCKGYGMTPLEALAAFYLGEKA